MTPRQLPPSSYSSIVETAISPFLIVDRGGIVTWAGSSIHELLGYEPDELVGAPVFDLVDPASHHAVIDALARIEHNVEQGTAPGWRSTGLVVELLTKGGEPVTCDVSGATSGRTGLDGYVVQLRRAPGSQGLRRAVEAMAAGRPVGDVLDTIAIAMNESFVETSFCILYEWDGSGFSAIAGTPTSLIDAGSDPSHEPPWVTAVYQRTRVVIDEPDSLALLGPAVAEFGLGGVAAQPVTIELMDRPAGAIFCWWTGATRSPSLDGTLTQVADQVALVLQWDQGRRALEWEANHDSLTGLDNRRAFVEDFHERTAAGTKGAVFYLDLDDFKAVNDQHGHLVGDTILAAAADRLRSCARPDDLVARIGGDEFAVFCDGLDDPSAANELAHRFVEAFADPVTVDGVSAQLGVSVGVAIVDSAELADSILARADARLLSAKSAGKGQVRDGGVDDELG